MTQNPMSRSWFLDTEVFLLHEIVAILDGLARKRVLEPRGLSYPEFMVVMSTRELDAPTQNEVGTFLDMSKSLVSQRVAALVAKGMLSQTRDPENRRQVRLELTEMGARTLDEIYKDLARNAGELFSALGPDRADFVKSLHRLIEVLAVRADAEGARAGKHPFHNPYQ